MGRFLRSLTGLVLLAAIVAGVPYGLWTYGRSLLPEQLPSLGEVKDALFTRDSGQIFITFVAIIVAVAWLLFIGCVILEIAARVSGRERARRIRGLRPAQAGAAALIGLIVPVVMLGGASVASAQTVSVQHFAAAGTLFTQTAPASTTHAGAHARAAAGSLSSQRPAAATAASHLTALATAPPSTAHQIWLVSRYDTLWTIAEKTLNDGRLYPEIVQLNIGVQQPDGKTLHDANTPLEIGWRLLLPARATLPDNHQPAPPEVITHQVTVHAGDTLSGIAQAELGSADAYPVLAVANHLGDPDDLRVGQILTIPGTSPVGQDHAARQAAAGEKKAAADTAAAEKAAAEKAAAEKAAAEKAAAEKAAAAKADSNRTQTSTRTGQPGPVSPAGSTEVTTTRVPTTAAAAQPPTTSVAAQETSVEQASDRHAVAESSQTERWLELGSGATAMAGALWLGLLAVRRRQRHRRPNKKVKAATSIPAAQLERKLRDQAGASDVVWMDKALRYAAYRVASQTTSELPDVTCVWLSPEELQLQLAAPVPAPDPFIAEDDSWILPADVDIPTHGWTEPPAPFPTLASLGEMDGESLLVDFERLGAVTVTGDARRTTALMRHLAVELAHNSWSDYLQVTLVGWGEHLRLLNPDRLRYAASVGDIITGLQGRIAETVDAEHELDTTLLSSRITGQSDDDAWSPELYLIDAGASTATDLTALAELMGGQSAGVRSAVAVIARHTDIPPADGVTIQIDADGKLTLPQVLGAMQIQAAGLSEHDLDLVVELFRSAGQFTPVGPIQSDQPWADQMDATGSLITTDPPVDVAAHRPPTTRPDVVDDNDQNDDHVGHKVVQLRVPVNPAAEAALQATLAGDPDLDADLAEWNDQLLTDPATARRESTPWIKRPRIGVLGEPLVLTNGTPPEDQHHRYTEFAVYFAVHREVQPTKFAADLWPEDNQPNPRLRTSYVSHTRAWLGLNEEGRKHLSEARAGRGYRLARLLDLELLRRLRKRADAKMAVGDTEGACTDLSRGLQLVRGPLLYGVPSDAYSWLTISDPEQLELAGATVVAAAHQLVTLALDAEDFDTARLAADTAYRFDPDDDQPKVDHVVIAHAAGDSATKRGWALRILRDHQAQLIEDVENYDTMIALSQVFPKGLRLAEAG